jgi:TolB-like protein/tetratricopeptide (TPR) repeat protein
MERHVVTVWLAVATACAWARPLYGQCSDGSAPPCRQGATRVVTARSLAVLYLQDLSGDTANTAIADGLSEEIIARLSQISGLRVPSRYASLKYRGRRASDPRQVGRDLGVRYVLDGTLRRAGGRMRIVLAITDASAGFNVWGQTYERRIDEIFSVEDSVAVAVAEVVLGRLSRGERARLTPPPASASTDAYQAYLRGRVAIRGRTATAAATAVAAYREAITLDPRFARAWAGLAHALSLARDWGWGVTGVAPDSLQPLAVVAAEQAVRLDSSSAESWLSAAMVERADDVRRALVLHRRAVALDSANVEAIHQLAWGYLANGELDSAITWERQAIARDPYYAFTYAGLGQMLDISGRAAEALAVLAQGIVVDSANAPLYWRQADVLLHLGRTAEAQVAAGRAATLGFDSLAVRVLAAIGRLREGDTASARAELPALERAATANLAQACGGLAFSACALLSGLYAQLGDVDGALRWAGQVPRWPHLFFAQLFGRHWLWEPVRGDARFREFLGALKE